MTKIIAVAALVLLAGCETGGYYGYGPGQAGYDPNASAKAAMLLMYMNQQRQQYAAPAQQGYYTCQSGGGLNPTYWCR